MRRLLSALAISVLWSAIVGGQTSVAIVGARLIEGTGALEPCNAAIF